MGDPRLSVGTSGWSYPGWLGPFYPTGTLPRDFLAVYAREFGAAEIDSTFCRIPTPKMVDAWNAGTPETFRFAPKVPHVITHEKRLENCAAELDTLLTSVRRLRPKLGHLVLQFDAGFRADRLPVLADFLAGLASDLRVSVEIQHRSWLCEDFYRLLDLRRGLAVFAFANNRFQGHGPTTARTPLARVAETAPQP